MIDALSLSGAFHTLVWCGVYAVVCAGILAAESRWSFLVCTTVFLSFVV